MADEVKIAYDKSDLRGITRAFKAMDDQAIEAAKRKVLTLLSMLLDRLRSQQRLARFQVLLLAVLLMELR